MKLDIVFLGHMFGDGLGVLQNQDKAIVFDKKEALLGDKDSAYSLSVLYSTTKALVTVNGSLSPALEFSPNEAYIWSKIAYALGEEYSFKRDGTKEALSNFPRGMAKNNQPTTHYRGR